MILSLFGIGLCISVLILADAGQYANASEINQVTIEFCKDCPYTGCCDSSIRCASNMENCFLTNATKIPDTTDTCTRECNSRCCINGQCGTFQQCEENVCYSQTCSNGCCQGMFCGTSAQCDHSHSFWRKYMWSFITMVIIFTTLAGIILLKQVCYKEDKEPPVLIYDRTEEKYKRLKMTDVPGLTS